VENNVLLIEMTCKLVLAAIWPEKYIFSKFLSSEIASWSLELFNHFQNSFDSILGKRMALSLQFNLL